MISTLSAAHTTDVLAMFTPRTAASPDLQNAKAEQDQADRANQGKDEIAQVIHDRKRIAVCRERRDNKNRQHEKHTGEDRVEPFCFGFKWFLQ